jgi:5-methyltetrahydrofolate--homocysteine methyltransferase
MDEVKILEEIRNCIVNINLLEIRNLIKKALSNGIPPYIILKEGMSKGMDIVGLKYESGEYFLTELIGAAAVMKEGMTEIHPYLGAANAEFSGKVIIGTVRGDLHDIGKDIVKTLLQSAGFEVYDLGVDVSPHKFIQKVKETGARIVALSALLTTTMQEMRTIIEELKKAGLRENVKVIIGGAPITEEFCREIGADAAAKDAAEGVRICKQWMEGGSG